MGLEHADVAVAVCVFICMWNLDEPQSLTEMKNISSITLLEQIYNTTPQCLPIFPHNNYKSEVKCGLY